MKGEITETKTVTTREDSAAAFDEYTLDEIMSAHAFLGLDFVCGDGVIQEIRKPIAGRYPLD